MYFLMGDGCPSILGGQRRQRSGSRERESRASLAVCVEREKLWALMGQVPALTHANQTHALGSFLRCIKVTGENKFQGQHQPPSPKVFVTPGSVVTSFTSVATLLQGAWNPGPFPQTAVEGICESKLIKKGFPKGLCLRR